MQHRSPTVEGFRVMFCRPAFGLAEVAWRWSFGLAAWLLLGLFVAEYLNSLTVSSADLFLLRARQPVLILRALLDIFRGSGVRLVEGLVVLAVALLVLWIVIASLSRAATVKALVGYFRSEQAAEASPRWRMRALLGLNFFRAAAFLAAILGCLAPIAALGSFLRDLSPGNVALVIIVVLALVGWAWSVVNWFLSLAALFVVSRGEDTFGAMGAVTDLCRDRPGPVFAAGAWFGLAHLGTFAIAVFFGLLAAGLTRSLSAAAGSVAILLVILLYLAVADFLYIGRLAAYLAIGELPDVSVAPVKPVAPGGGRAAPADQLGAIDRDELILSDLPPPS